MAEKNSTLQKFNFQQNIMSQTKVLSQADFDAFPILGEKGFAIGEEVVIPDGGSISDASYPTHAEAAAHDEEKIADTSSESDAVNADETEEASTSDADNADDVEDVSTSTDEDTESEDDSDLLEDAETEEGGQDDEATA